MCVRARSLLLVIFLFLRNVRATGIPSLALPLSIVGTFAVMYLLGYSIDNFSLMALTLSVGFVVDDAMTKGSQLKICVEFAVDARELIQVECGCDAERVVVSRF